MSEPMTEKTVTGDAERTPDCEHCRLDCVRKGDALQVVSVDDELARIQCLRFGMAEGATVDCITRIPAGPIVLKSGRQEIAVGRSLAKRITVRRLLPELN